MSIAGAVQAQTVTTAGQPAQLDIRPAEGAGIRITLKPISFNQDFPFTPAVVKKEYAAPVISLRELSAPVTKKVGSLQVEVRSSPLTIIVSNAKGETVQRLEFDESGELHFRLADAPVLGMGEGGPRPERGTPWRQQAIQFDRRGKIDSMQPRWQADMYGSRNPSAMMLGTSGWGLFVATPWGQIDLRAADRGVFLPWTPSDADRGRGARRPGSPDDGRCPTDRRRTSRSRRVDAP